MASGKRKRRTAAQCRILIHVNDEIAFLLESSLKVFEIESDMCRTFRHVLSALAALAALGWGGTPAPAGEATPVVIADVVVAADSHHGEAQGHCAAGAGAGCQVPALTGATFVLISGSGSARGALPAAMPGAALARPGPPQPVPIG